MNREELKRLWWSIPHNENKTPTYNIVVQMDKYPGRKGQGTVQIIADDKNGWSSSSHHCENPMEFALNKMKDKCNNRLEYSERYDYSKYKLIIK